MECNIVSGKIIVAFSTVILININRSFFVDRCRCSSIRENLNRTFFTYEESEFSEIECDTSVHHQCLR